MSVGRVGAVWRNYGRLGVRLTTGGEHRPHWLELGWPRPHRVLSVKGFCPYSWWWCWVFWTQWVSLTISTSAFADRLYVCLKFAHFQIDLAAWPSASIWSIWLCGFTDCRYLGAGVCKLVRVSALCVQVCGFQICRVWDSVVQHKWGKTGPEGELWLVAGGDVLLRLFPDPAVSLKVAFVWSELASCVDRY